MTEINEESRYDTGESRQLGRNERDVLIASNKGEDYEQEIGGSTVLYRKSTNSHNVLRNFQISEKYHTNNQIDCDNRKSILNDFMITIVIYYYFL